MDWPPADSFVLRCLSMVCATVIVAIGATVAKRAIGVAKDTVAMVGGLVVALAIVAVGFRLFSTGYFVGY